MSRFFEEVRCNYLCEDDRFWRVDAWRPDKEEGEVIAYIDDITGRVLYHNPEARVDGLAKEVIAAKMTEIAAYAIDWEAIAKAAVKSLQEELYNKFQVGADSDHDADKAADEETCQRTGLTISQLADIFAGV